MKLFALRRFFPLLCFAVLSSHTWANDGEKKEWGYQRDGQSQTKFEEALQLLNNTQGVSLSPHSASDVVLSSFILAKDGNGFRSVSMENTLNAETQDLFWFVDTRTNTYRTFRMTWNIEADARRLHPFIQQHLPAGTSYSMTRTEQSIAEAYSMKLDQIADAAERTANYGYPVCWGGGRARIAAYDPVRIKLVETDAYADWSYDGTGAYIVNGGGYCWANPRTRLNTTWFVETCNGNLTATPYVARSRTYNLSYNDDFLDDNQRTWVLQKTQVHQNFGNAGWRAIHTDWGEASYFIWGWILLGYAFC